MRKPERARLIREQLHQLYPEPPIPLDHTDAYTLLVAVLLSAQCTDARVNLVTPSLFEMAGDPASMAQQPVESILSEIKSCGLAPTKAKNIKNLSIRLMDDFDGQVPADLKALESLPGVGHKTAQVVMAQAFGEPSFPVDTHIFRLARRWKLSNGKTVAHVEKDLKRIYPKKYWNDLHLQIIYFGREYCTARSHDDASCPICSWVHGHRPPPSFADA